MPVSIAGLLISRYCDIAPYRAERSVFQNMSEPAEQPAQKGTHRLALDLVAVAYRVPLAIRFYIVFVWPYERALTDRGRREDFADEDGADPLDREIERNAHVVAVDMILAGCGHRQPTAVNQRRHSVPSSQCSNVTSAKSDGSRSILPVWAYSPELKAGVRVVFRRKWLHRPATPRAPKPMPTS